MQKIQNALPFSWNSLPPPLSRFLTHTHPLTHSLTRSLSLSPFPSLSLFLSLYLLFLPSFLLLNCTI